MELLRKKDLYPQVDAAKSTVADWIEDFSAYIPKIKRGNVTYYRPEAIDVLKFIKQCREQNYQKPQIFELLAEKGFPMTVEDAVEDVRKAFEGETHRDNLLAVMQTMGQAMSKLVDQEEKLIDQDGKIIEHEEALKSLKNQQDWQDERIKTVEERTEEIELLKQEIQALKKELAAAREETKKGFFARLFGK